MMRDNMRANLAKKEGHTFCMSHMSCHIIQQQNVRHMRDIYNICEAYARHMRDIRCDVCRTYILYVPHVMLHHPATKCETYARHT